MRERVGMIVGVLAVIALVAAMVVYGMWRRTDSLANGAGELRVALIIEGATPAVVALESLTFSDEDSDETVFRLTAIDALSGKRLARKVEVTWDRCVAANAGLLWCTQHGDVAVVSVPSLEVRSDAEVVKGKVGQKMTDADRLELMRDGKLKVVLADGARVVLDAETLIKTPQPDREPPLPKDLRPTYSVCALPSTERRGLCHWTNRGDERVDVGEGFLRPEILGRSPTGLLLVTHTSLDEGAAELQLVMLDEQAKEISRVSLGSARAFSFSSNNVKWSSDRTWLIISSQGQHKTVAIDALKGTVRWWVHH